MTHEQAHKRVEALREEIDRHNRLYYVDSAPEITDLEFDQLLKELADLEREFDLAIPDSPTQRVGGAPIDAFRTVAHLSPMLSIDNTYSQAEVLAWAQRVEKGVRPGRAEPMIPVEYVCTPKIDGVAISLVYEDGKLM